MKRLQGIFAVEGAPLLFMDVYCPFNVIGSNTRSNLFCAIIESAFLCPLVCSSLAEVDLRTAAWRGA